MQIPLVLVPGRPWSTIVLQATVIGLSVWLLALQPSPLWATVLLSLSLALLAVRLIALIAIPTTGSSSLATGAPDPRLRRREVLMAAAAGAAALLASASSGATNGIGTFPAAVAAAIFLSEIAVPIGAALAVCGAAILLHCLSAGFAGASISQLVNTLFGLGIGIAAGLSWRQRAATARDRARAAERELALRDEARKRSLARDLHDVLAHSLGGLVVQLDAVALQIEAGRIEAAGARVAAARELAVEGLREARAAVHALREGNDEEPVPWPILRDRICSIANAVGGDLEVVLPEGADQRARALSASAAMAIERAAQEGLANARKHGGGATRLLLEPGSDDVRLRVENALAQGGHVNEIPGGGFGLRGLRERVLSLGPPAAMEAGERAVDDESGPRMRRFVLSVTVPFLGVDA
ncbi:MULTISPECIES: sensor histidine kinase [unclassified Leucobacter]|uniref:sensor histidine kinase n=1 Tax=unclassified Leucobacter TaxID=2621730 RepID=UPI00069BA15B|nr:histidine kinase [Leucobacter sp. Ag1]